MCHAFEGFSVRYERWSGMNVPIEMQRPSVGKKFSNASCNTSTSQDIENLFRNTWNLLEELLTYIPR